LETERSGANWVQSSSTCPSGQRGRFEGAGLLARWQDRGHLIDNEVLHRWTNLLCAAWMFRWSGRGSAETKRFGRV